MSSNNYNVRADVCQQNPSDASSKVLSIRAQGVSDSLEFHGSFTPTQIEKITHDSGLAKSFDTFAVMLQSAIENSSSSVRYEVCTFQELSQRLEGDGSSSSVATTPVPIRPTTSRFFVLHYEVDFTSTWYTLPLHLVKQSNNNSHRSIPEGNENVLLVADTVPRSEHEKLLQAHKTLTEAHAKLQVQYKALKSATETELKEYRRVLEEREAQTESERLKAEVMALREELQAMRSQQVSKHTRTPSPSGCVTRNRGSVTPMSSTPPRTSSKQYPTTTAAGPATTTKRSPSPRTHSYSPTDYIHQYQKHQIPPPPKRTASPRTRSPVYSDEGASSVATDTTAGIRSRGSREYWRETPNPSSSSFLRSRSRSPSSHYYDPPRHTLPPRSSSRPRPMRDGWSEVEAYYHYGNHRGAAGAKYVYPSYEHQTQYSRQPHRSGTRSPSPRERLPFR